MDENAQNSQTLFPHETGHHRSARERQRKGPMWGCLKGLGFGFAALLLILLIVVGGGWWYLGTTSFGDLVALRVAKTLEARLGRHVTIGGVALDRRHLQRVVLNDLRIANAPGAANPYFATVRQVIITGGLDSFWGRRIKVGRVDVVDPRIYFEIYPAGGPLVHNFPHWNSGPPSKYTVVHVALNKLYVRGGAFEFLDRRHQITALATGLATDMTVTGAEDLYAGIVSSPRVNVRIQDYESFDLDLRGGFRYTPGALSLQSVAMKGNGMQVFLSGKVAPLSEAAYDLRLTSQVALQRIRQIFRVNKRLEGVIALDTRLRGKAGDFALTGGWVSSRINADAYELTAAKGRMSVTGDRTVVEVDSAKYGGGTIGAHYTLTQYAEPYPMTVELRYNGISIEHLFSDWTIENTGLSGAATGHLTYHWNKDKILEGGGVGTAQLSKTTAFSGAKYPIPVGGALDYALDRGVVSFRSAELDTPASHVSLTGTLRVEDIFTDLRMRIHSSDFSELDRVGYNFAHSAGKKAYNLLGLGGAGDITGTVRGRIKTPTVVAHIDAAGAKFNNVVLGGAAIDLHYDGVRSLLTFDRAIFNEGGGRLALTGTVGFPDRGPSPTFDIAVEANGYPVDRAVKAVDLKLAIGGGNGTGRLIVTGDPDRGKVTFANLIIRRGTSELRLNGDVAWKPGKGNVDFDLAIAARSFPVSDIVTFLDLGTFPVTGELTGTLRLQGPKNALEGAGAITVRKGTIYGEPINVATAEIVFTHGAMKATNISIQAPAGTVTGEAQLNLSTNEFSYTINSSSIDLSKIKLLSTLQGLLGGNVKLTSSGGGTFNNPELVVEATLNEATLRGLALPPDAPPPTLYVAIRGGRLIVRGSAANVLSIEGDGTVGNDLAVNGLVRVTVSDIAKLLAMSPNTSSIPASGNLVMDLRLGGKLSSLEALQIDATVPTLDLTVSDHKFTTPQPLHLSLRNGRVSVESFELQRSDSAFLVTGYADLTGNKALALHVRGSLEAALLQLFVPGLRSDGRIDMAVTVGGTLAGPAITGTADLENAQVKFPGFPQLIDNINGRINFAGDKITIEALQATVGGGKVGIGGKVGLAGLKPQSVDLALTGTGVSIRYFEGVTVDSDFVLTLRGGMDRMTLRGDVTVNRALYFKDFDFRQSLLNVILSRRGVTPVVAASWQDRVNLDLRLTAANTLAVRNNVANLTGSANVDVTGTLANPVVLGAVTLNEGGTVTFQNIDYRLVRGTIDFVNPFRIDPYFDVTLEGRVSGSISEVETGPLDVTVNITGTLDRITPTISSDPPASDVTLFSILGLGGLTRQGTGTGPAVPASLVGQSLLYQSLFSALGSRVLPFADSFSYDPGLLDTGSTAAGRKVTFEKRVSNTVRVIIVYNIDNTRTRAVVEWAVTPDWTLQLTRDNSASQDRLDARFNRRYAAHWTWGRHGRQTEDVFPLVSVADSVHPQGAPAGQTMTPLPRTTPVTALPAGAVVSQVEFRLDRPLTTSALSQYVTVKPGQPLALRDIQASIKALFASGNFRDIRVDAAQTTGGVQVTFALYLNYRIGKIVFNGLTGSERARATRDVRIRSGDTLSLNAVDDAATEMQDFLKRDGYLEAAVDPETAYVSERNVANVTFTINPGPQARVAAVQIEGQVAPFAPAELIGRMKEKPGQPFRLSEARNDADRMKNYLVRKDYRRADVRFIDDTYDPESKTVTVRYHATAGPVVKVEVTGVSRSAVKGVIPFRRNQEYSEDAIDRAADDIVRLYQQRGYFRAAVDTESRLTDNTWITTFKVNPGQHYNLTGVTFSGNIKVPDKKLAGVVETSKSGLIRRLFATLFRRPTGVTQTQLSADRDALESYYRLQGFSEATVATPVATTKADGTMTIDFPVTEGPQTLVTGVAVEGTQQVTGRDLPRLQLQPGRPLNPQLEREDVVALQTFYANRGNTEVQITPRIDVSADKTAARVTYVVAEGPQIKVADVVVSGNTYTDSTVILRKAEIAKGDPFSYTSVLEAQRNLYRLGIFNRVEVQPQQAGTAVSERNILISVEEGKELTASGSLGLLVDRGPQGGGRNISPRVSAAVAHRNLFGTGRYLGLEGVYARHSDEQAYLTYREPFLGRYNIPVQVTVFRTDDSTRKGLRILQQGTSIEASKVAFLRTRWSLVYQYKTSECKEGSLCTDVQNNIPIPTLPRELLNIQMSSLTPTFFWDKRDDIVDPHHGFFTSASVEYAFPMFNARSNFLKEFAQGAWYLPVTDQSVFAFAGRVGLIHSLGHSAASRFVPLSERFIAGGESTHRAFPLDLLGNACLNPQQTSTDCREPLYDIDNDPGKVRLVPLGGNGIFLVNAEYRFPILGSVGGALFTDIGNVYGGSTIHFDDLRYGVGGGIRYLSPVGPLRFDIGWPLNRRSYERPFSYSISLGYAF